MCKLDKFIVVGDLHASFTGPKKRQDNYYSCFVDKIKQIKDIQEKNDNCPIICLGDFFNNKIVEHLEKIAFDLIPLMKNFYSLIGNHDNHKENALDLRGTSFGLFKETGLIGLGSDFKNKYDNDKMNFDFYDYYNRNEFKNKNLDNNKINIAFIHDYIMPKNTKVNYEFKQCVETEYDYVFCGHYHYDYDYQIGKTRYINPGSLMRMTIANEDINRHPKIILFDFNSKDKIKYIKLDIKSSKDVLNNVENILDNNFESKFTEMLLKNDIISGDVNDITNILKKNNVSKEIIDYIEEKSQEVKND